MAYVIGRSSYVITQPKSPEEKGAYNDGWNDARSGQNHEQTYAFALVDWYLRGQHDAEVLLDIRRALEELLREEVR
jgi:hypothetical protein